MGAEYAYWRDYHAPRRLRLLARWNVIMPALTLVLGYFPGRRLGWLEGLPPRVALEGPRGAQGSRIITPPAEQAEILEAFSRVSAPVVAIHVGDDEFASLTRIERALSYYVGVSAALRGSFPLCDVAVVSSILLSHPGTVKVTDTSNMSISAL